MELDQVDRVRLQPLERAANLLAGRGVLPLAGLRRQEELGALAAHPAPNTHFCVAVARRRVDVVHAVPQKQLERHVGLRLGGAAEGRGAEERT